MARQRKSKEQIAQEARNRHERLYQQVQKGAGQPGITKLRLRLQDALMDRMAAELKARQA